MLKALLKFLPIYKYRISGDSMFPTLKPGNTVLVSKFSYLLKSPKIEDIVAIHDPRDRRVLIKRITKIESKKYYVLGDNRKQSTDSRSFGWIGKNDIIGKVIFHKK